MWIHPWPFQSSTPGGIWRGGVCACSKVRRVLNRPDSQNVLKFYLISPGNGVAGYQNPQIGLQTLRRRPPAGVGRPLVISELEKSTEEADT